jgi:hypothetical protein
MKKMLKEWMYVLTKRVNCEKSLMCVFFFSCLWRAKHSIYVDWHEFFFLFFFLFIAMQSKAFMWTGASLLSFFLSWFTHWNFGFYVAMISEMECQKIFVEIRHKNIEIESLPSVFWSFVGCFVRLKRAQQESKYFWASVLFHNSR